jgi:glutamate-1-semialdehyde 2,1-aminomutase
LTAGPVLDDLARRGQRLKSGVGEILSEAGIPHQLTGHPNMQAFLITEKTIKDYRGYAHHDAKLYAAIMDNLYQLNVWMEADAREPWFLCEAHTDAVIDETLNKFEDAVKAAKP